MQHPSFLPSGSSSGQNATPPSSCHFFPARSAHKLCHCAMRLTCWFDVYLHHPLSSMGRFHGLAWGHSLAEAGREVNNTVGDFEQALCDMATSEDTHLANGFCQPPRPVGARGG